MRLFITATDTEVGKTHVSTLIARHARSLEKTIAAFKPVSCGDRGDAEALMAAADSGLPLDEINPVHFDRPVAPSLAGTFDFEAVATGLVERAEAFDSVVIEGVGGWLVPLTAQRSVEDLARRFGYPVLVVVGDRLGAINHARLTVQAVRQSGVPFAGIILNQFSSEFGQWGNAEALRELFGSDFWGEIPHRAMQWPEAMAARLAH